ncbi:MAG TPA: hypothetical protein VJA82_03805, partial [Sediminibacterium sp.]|uniref:hypothetical protein n=1 Tax=Sediminibacterium sp. TaxID=1917865 RepID=UPI002B4B75C9
SWAFSNGTSALEFQMNFSNLALTNRVYSGQASSWITDYPTSAKPRTLSASSSSPIVKVSELFFIRTILCT